MPPKTDAANNAIIGLLLLANVAGFTLYLEERGKHAQAEAELDARRERAKEALAKAEAEAG